jgi:dTDP-4-amino-4,6-dideoxygalactose transaminase
MKIQFSDLGAQHKEIKNEINKAVKCTILRGDFILGEDVKLFEAEFGKFCGVKYALGLSSGTAALFLALRALGISANDEVIVPAYTYIATALAVSYTGAKPVFVDIDEATYNIDVDKIKSAITKKTKAIIPVHLYGQMADMSGIMKIAKEYNLRVIEDAAQAHGATIKMANRNIGIAGAIGDIGCFSFYPSKNLGGMGDGGMVVTNNDKLHQQLRMLRDYGRVSKYEHAVIGYNSRLDTLQASILRAKLKKLNKWNAMRREAAAIYNALFKDMPEVVIPFVAPGATPVYHVYAIRTPKRDLVFQQLTKQGVGVIVHYPIPLHLQKAYQELRHKRGDFPVAERVSEEIISLPMYPHIKRTQIKFVVDNIKKVLKNKG